MMAESRKNENVLEIHRIKDLVEFFRTNILTGQDAEDLSKLDLSSVPKAEVLHILFMRVLQNVYGIRPEHFCLAPLPEDIQWPVFYEGAMPVLGIYRSMCQFLPYCDVHDFCLNDLLYPERRHTITILSGIQNFLTLRNKRLELMSGHQQSFSSLSTDQVAEWKRQLEEKSQKLSQMELEMATLKEEIAKLSQIVESSEEFMSEMKKMKTSMENATFSEEQLDKMLVDIFFMVLWAHQEDAEIQDLLKQLRGVQKSFGRSNQQREEVRRLAALLETLQRELKSLSNEEDQLKGALAMKLDKKPKKQIHHQKKKEMKDPHIQSITGQYDKIREKCGEILKCVQHLNTETLRFKLYAQTLVDNCTLDTEKDMFDRLIYTLDQYHRHAEDILMKGTAFNTTTV